MTRVRVIIIINNNILKIKNLGIIDKSSLSIIRSHGSRNCSKLLIQKEKFSIQSRLNNTFTCSHTDTGAHRRRVVKFVGGLYPFQEETFKIPRKSPFYFVSNTFMFTQNWRKNYFCFVYLCISADSERSDECIDFTMMCVFFFVYSVISRNNAPISNFGSVFRCKSEYRSKIPYEFSIFYETCRKRDKLQRNENDLFSNDFKHLLVVDKIFLTQSKFLKIEYKVPHNS
ncbi:Uncharacterized protein FWK35_00009844 [Aphis craccivora]|uniref:Uncharacterized protein n=1 Tax=Aphis craccivora TaxID=307492 RepID=A0A6G0ZEF3_APHCR|nr:Uncharacterized protein FWK35_00009844 [Aphis craccivora]